MRRRSRRGIALLCGVIAGCAPGIERGEPLEDPRGIAAANRSGSGTEVPVRVFFDWEYADERGNLRGDGIARVNPSDRFRLDLFSTGEGSVSAALVDGDLQTGGDIEDFEFPPPAFLYAMAGVFRPGDRPPVEGFRSGALDVLGYAEGDGERHFYFEAGRLVRVEERRAGRLERRIEVTWGARTDWPEEARYRDDVTPSRVRWRLTRTRAESEPFEDEIYAIPPGAGGP